MQWRRLATPVVLGVAVVTVAALATSAHGYPVLHANLNDGAIWVTDNASAAASVGRFAKPIGQLDGIVNPKSATSVNVWQDGPLVATYGSSAAGGRLYAVNVNDTNLASPDGTAIAPVTADTSGIALGGDPDGATATLAVLGTDHSLRSATLTSGTNASLTLDSLAQTSPPLAKGLPGNSAVAVGADGTIWVAGGGKLREFPPGAITPAVTSLPQAMRASDSMQVTTVGNVPVVADATARSLYLPGSGQTVPLPPAATAAGFVLQQPSGPGGFVVAASSAALYSVNLSSGQLITLSDGHAGTVAAPVQVGGCVQAAWANGENGTNVRDCGTPSPATAAVQPFNTGDASPHLVFRVNNGAVVLNDTANGGVFLVDSKITNVTPQWQQSTSGVKSPLQTKTAGKQQDQFRANPLTQGVRPGVTTEVHVLDAVKGDPKLTYAVTAVGKPDQPGVAVSVAPDSQTVLAAVTELAGNAHFQYTVDDGQGHTSTNAVTLMPRTPGENNAPQLKQDYRPPSLSVASGGTLIVPVTGSWRDGDGDAPYLDSGSVRASAGSAAVTSGGALSFTAPRSTAGETATLSYGISDGRAGKPTMTTLKVSVHGSSSKSFVAPTAEPDAAQAMAGMPVTLRPLSNDLPGIDPTNPQAKLRVAAPVGSSAGTTVATDLADGTVTFTASHPGDYFLRYTDAYGAAPTAKGTIRVHVIAASGKPQPPVTTPDVAVLHGQQPALVDALADASDPQGWLMGITDATSATRGVHVTVLDSEWLRISADNPVPGMTATVTYTVSDGKGSAKGTVSVSAVAADPGADQITTTRAAVTVRAGDSAAVPVLDGDTSSTGLALSLAGPPPTVTPPVAGLLVGVQGNSLRVVAPSSAKSEEETAVSYVATDANGTAATGELDVTIMPAPSKANADQAPVPQQIDAREAPGDTAVIQIPTSGVDSDGDSVTVTGVTVPPALGRVVAVGPDSVSYQSYPGSAGTDTFTYQVTDPFGLTGTAQVRVAVLPPGPPQPPVAVDDVISAPPGASLHWNVLGNDYIAPGDKVTVQPLAKTNTAVPRGVRLAGTYVYLPVPAASAPPATVTYGATDGTTPSLAQVTVHAVPGAKIPPTASDVIAPLPQAGAKNVTVNVLKHADDPLGSPDDLKVSWAGSGATVDGANLTAKLACYPYAVPFQVTAPDRLTATAVVYVQGTIPCPHSAAQAGTSTITLKPGARITLKQNGTVTVPLGSVLTDSAGRQLKITTTDTLTASPAGDLAVAAMQETAVTVHALGGYTGPGAVTVQVYDGKSMQDKDGTTATVTIPVQVGSDVPVLHCPAAPLQVVEGGAAQSYDIGQLCHVSVDAGQAAPRYTVSWAKEAPGVSATVPGGTALQLSAAGTAKAGTTGTLKITPGGAGAGKGGTLSVQVVKAPMPTGRPASVSAKAGESVTVDLSQYVTSPLPKPAITVLGVTTQPGSTATATVTRSGSKVTVTPGAAASGTLNLTASVSDEAGRADRAISVAVAVTVTGRPGAPGQPAATASGTSLVVSFGAAAPNGTPVEYYTVYTNATGHQCAASPCTITGLAAGTYTVYVTATNSAGTGPKSPQTTAKLSAVPGQVTGLAATPGNGQVALTWQAATGNPTGYQATISPPPAGQGGIQQLGVTTSHTFTGLTNGTSYTFTVQATSASGNGPASVGVSAVPLGKPPAMAAPSATALPASATGAGSHTSATVTTIRVSVNPGSSADNGSPITGYTIYEYKAASSGGPWGSPVATGTAAAHGGGMVLGPGNALFDVNNDGSWYEFTATQTNAVGESAQSPLSSPAIQASQAATPPSAPSGVTAKATGQDGTIQFSFTAGGSTGNASTLIKYGINSATESGTINGPFTAGTSYTETLTNASSSAIANGTPVTVYVAECNSANLCSSFAGPSAQVTPHGPIATPKVTATANGTAIAYTWSAQSDGLAETLQVCIAGTCSNHSVPAAGGYSGSSSATYGNGQTETITAHLTDSAGQSSGTATASATTPAAQPPPPPPSAANPSVSVGQGSAFANGTGTCSTKTCYFTSVTATHFPANTALSYTCVSGNGPAVDNGQWYGPATAVHSGSTTTNGSGSTTFQTECLHALNGETVTINVTGGGQSASGTWTT